MPRSAAVFAIKDDVNVNAEPAAIQRLSRDLAAASATLSLEEVKYVVSMYYAWQERRKESGNQKRELMEGEKPHAIIAWLFDQETTMESQIKRSLDKFTDSHRVGAWMKSIYGIGPVIAAGLLSHIDIHRAPTVGHIWRYAGLDPTVSWKGKEVVTKALIERVNEVTKTSMAPEARAARMKEIELIMEEDFQATPQLCREITRMPGDLRKWHVEYEALLNFDTAKFSGLRKGRHYVDLDLVRWAAFHFGRSYETLIRYMTDEETGELNLTMTELANAVVRRPWNGDLKVLCWKAGQSFMKTHNDENSVYGHLYAEQKAKYVRKNLEGGFAERAAREISRYDPSTQTYGHMKEGRLSPANIDAMARRWAVKIFLSHVHHVMHWDAFDAPPPKPFAIELLGHAHVIRASVPEWAPFTY